MFNNTFDWPLLPQCQRWQQHPDQSRRHHTAVTSHRRKSQTCYWTICYMLDLNWIRPQIQTMNLIVDCNRIVSRPASPPWVGCTPGWGPHFLFGIGTGIDNVWPHLSPSSIPSKNIQRATLYTNLIFWLKSLNFFFTTLYYYFFVEEKTYHENISGSQRWKWLVSVFDFGEVLFQI